MVMVGLGVQDGDDMGQTQTMLGKRFGRLTVIEFAGISKTRKALWICQCDCGTTTKPIAGYRLRGGTTKSCGCYKRDLVIQRNTKHNLCYTRIHRIWAGMQDRCYNPNSPNYHRYGARGITVCEEWLNSLETFYDWAMENGYRDDLTIDRIDNDGNYEPSNCRWATNEEQANNRGHNILVEIDGNIKTLAQLSKESGIKYRTIHARYNRGWRGKSLIKEV